MIRALEGVIAPTNTPPPQIRGHQNNIVYYNNVMLPGKCIILFGYNVLAGTTYYNIYYRIRWVHN